MSKAWVRLPGENNLWWDRFERYRLMGPNRSLLTCYNQERAANGIKETKYVPGSWHGAEVRFKWQERAEAYDESERQKNETEHVSDKAKAKAQRQKLINGLMSIALNLYEQNEALAEEGNQINPYYAQAASTVIRAALAESRLEFGEPTQINGLVGADGGPIQTQELSELGISQEQKHAIIRQAAARLELVK